MRYSIDAMVEVEKDSLFGRKKTVLEPQTIWVDEKTYQNMKKGKTNLPYEVEEQSLFDEIFGD